MGQIRWRKEAEEGFMRLGKVIEEQLACKKPC